MTWQAEASLEVRVRYCLGSESRDGPGGNTPAGTLHAVVLADAYDGVAVCGQRVMAWPGKKFANSSNDDECTVCRNVVAGLF